MKVLTRFGPILGLALVLSVVAFGVVATTRAAPGTNLSTIIAMRPGTACASTNAAGDHGSVGVGIAFNGTNLLISCIDNTVTEVTTAGALVGVHPITGASNLGALAYNASASKLYGCSGSGDVVEISLASNMVVGLPLFNTLSTSFDAAHGGPGTGSGCFDGLAYDGITNEFWASGDVSSTTEHYTFGGAAIYKYINGLPSGNSGIAVGGAQLYLANDGGSTIFSVNKNFTPGPTVFATFPARLEDLECDSVTFAAAGKGAIWSIDAYDNRLNAWEIAPGLCVFGGGVTPVPTQPVGGLVDVVTGGGASSDGNSMLLVLGGFLAVAMGGAAVFAFRRASIR